MSDDVKIHALEPGDQLGEYIIKGMLGKGGMGEVYLAEHSVMHKYYAIKTLPEQLSASPHFISRFKIEARVMADLEHPHIVRVHHLGHVDECYFLTMDFVEYSDGNPRTLEEEIRSQGTMPEEEVVKYARQMCDALEYAHGFRGEGIIHRDLKPANVLMGGDGNIKIADFGIAKIVGAEYLHSMLERSIGVTQMAHIADAETMVAQNTNTAPTMKRETSTVQAIIGTYDYMSPEQKEGRPASVQSDIFAMGVILYRMLTGRKPEGIWEMPSKFGAHKAWDTIVATCMQQDPKDRYYSVRDLEAALNAVKIGKKRSGGGALAGLLSNRTNLLMAAGCAALLTFVGVGSYFAFFKDPDRSQAKPPEAPLVDPVPTPGPGPAPGPGPVASIPKPPEAGPIIKPAGPAPAGTVKARSEVEALRQSLLQQNIDRAHGFQALFDILAKDWSSAEQHFQQRKFDAAEGTYQGIREQIINIESLQRKRAQAVVQQGEVATNRLVAETAGAMRHSREGYEEARKMEDYALKSLDAAQFDEALKGFGLAASGYEKSAQTARIAGLMDEQAEGFNKAMTLAGPSRLSLIKQYQPEQEQVLQAHIAIGRDPAKSYQERTQAYRQAKALLAQLQVSAAAAKKQEEEREAARIASASTEEKAQMAKEKAAKERQAILAAQQEQDRIKAEAAARKAAAENERMELARLEQERNALEKKQQTEVKQAVLERRNAEVLRIPVGDLAIEMRRIPAGTFMMGRDSLFGRSDESPRHEVEITRPFWMATHEVTQAAYLELTGQDPSRVKGSNLPVETVSWSEASDFCKKLEKAVHEYLGSTDYEVRLPTEAEWEYACRAGTTTSYFSGDDLASLDAHAWFASNSQKQVHPVATKQANAFGLYDMHGNLWEHVYDWYDAKYYARSPKQDPMGPPSGRNRVARGGSFAEAAHCAAYGRWDIRASVRDNVLGFRFVIVEK